MRFGSLRKIRLKVARMMAVLMVLDSFFVSFVPGASADITNGMNAFDVLGQGGSFTSSTGNGFSATGLRSPTAIAVDTVHHRLFVGNNFAPDILEYDLNTSNVLIDRTADHVLGAPTISGGPDYATNTFFDNIDAIAYDPTGDRLFVADSAPSTNRVLVFDVATIVDGENAVSVLGQPNINTFTFPSSPVNGSKMRPHTLVYDNANKRLFVGDFGTVWGGYRVLVFDVTSITDGETAVNVLGQPDLATKTANTQNAGNGCTATPNACGLDQMDSLAYDDTNQRLFVGDSGNHRVEVFDVTSITDGETAVKVLGKTTFTDGGVPTPSQSAFSGVSGLGYDNALQRLFLSSSFDNRTLMFDVNAITNGENAVNVIGQTNFSNTGFATTQSGQNSPNAIAFGGNNTLYVVDGGNNRVLLYGVTPAATASIDQNAYRWRNDNGSETSATYAAAENTPLATFPKNSPKRLRFGEANSGTDSELLQEARLTLQNSAAFGLLRGSVIDTAGGFAYFGSSTAASIIKVRLSDLQVVANLLVTGGDFVENAAAIDTVNGFAYFGLFASPGKIVKVRLSDFTINGSLILNSGEDIIGSVVLDVANDFGYFGTRTSPGKVVKVTLSTLTRVSAVTFAAGEITTAAGVIDTVNGVTYWGTGAVNPAKVIKVTLSPFAYVSSLTAFAAGEGVVSAGVIDVTNQFAYFGSSLVSPALVAKINLTSFTLSTKITLSSGENNIMSAAIDNTNQFAYFGTDTTPGKIVKINLTAFGRDSAVTLSSGENRLFSMVIDLAAGKLYTATFTTPGIVVRVGLSGFTRETAMTYTAVTQGNWLDAAVIDTVNGFAYFAATSDPGQIVKVRLSDMTWVETLTLPAGETIPEAGVIDTVNGFAYFSTSDAFLPTVSKIVKVDINPTHAFARIGSISLGAGELKPRSAVIDVANGFAYFGMFGTSGSAGKVAKVDINPTNVFAEIGSPVLFNAGERYPRTAVIDTAAGFAYFGTIGTVSGGGGGTPGTDTFVVKVNISPGGFARVGSLGLETNSVFSLRSSVIDTSGITHFAYFADQQGHIAKINLNTFAYDSKVTDSDNMALSSGVMDTANGFAYFGGNNGFSLPTTIYKIDVDPSRTFAEVDKIVLDSDEKQAFSAVIDPAKGYAYFGMNTGPGIVAQISIAPHVQFRLEYGVAAPTCAATSSWTQVGAPAGGQDWVMVDTANITNGAPTTDSAGLTNGNTSFQPGEIHDTTSQTGMISLGEKQFTELEFNIKAAASDVNGTAYCFRLTDAGTAAGLTYSQFGQPTNNGTGFGLGSGTNNPTLANRIVLSRAKAGVSSTVDIFMTLQNTLSGTLTVSFPAGFTVTQAATGGSACLSAFGFTSSTLTATKTNCTGAIGLTGATVTNPSTPGAYQITWVNDDPGGGTVYITSDDQVNVSAVVEPLLAFNVGSQAAATSCSGSFSGAGGNVVLGALSTGVVASSDASSVPHICTRLSTNAATGAAVTVKSANASLKSTSTPADTIPSTGTTLVAGTAGYGICGGSAGGDSGVETTVPAGTSPSRSVPFSGSCTSGAHAVGALTSSAQNLWTLFGASQNAFVRLYIKAAISPTTPAHNDYTDTLTFVATGTF